jgi:hypothetical protein
MTFILTVIFLAVLAGALLTYQQWEDRGQPAIQRQLAKLWVGISLLAIILIGLTATSTGLFAWYLYHRLAGELANSGFATGLAKTFAALAALPLAIFVTWAISLTEWKRNVGLAGLFLVVAACSYARYVHRDTTAFSAETGASLDGYTVLLDGYLKRCDTSFDRASGQPCLPITPVVQQFLAKVAHAATCLEGEPFFDEDGNILGVDPPSEACRAKHRAAQQVFIASPTIFFNLNPATELAEPIIWHCERGDGAFHFVRIPIRDPMTGEECSPVTEEMIGRWRRGEPPIILTMQNEPELPEATTPPPASPSSLPASPVPFIEDFEDGHHTSVDFSEGWTLDMLPKKRSCSQGSHCMCTRGQGSINIARGISFEQDVDKLRSIFFDILVGQDLKITITLGSKAGAQAPLAVFKHRTQLNDDTAPITTAQLLDDAPATQQPAALEPGWYTVVIPIRLTGNAARAHFSCAPFVKRITIPKYVVSEFVTDCFPALSWNIRRPHLVANNSTSLLHIEGIRVDVEHPYGGTTCIDDIRVR